MALFERSRACLDVEVGIFDRKSRVPGDENVTGRLDLQWQPDALNLLVRPVDRNPQRPDRRPFGESARDACNGKILGIDPDGPLDQILAQAPRCQAETIDRPPLIGIHAKETELVVLRRNVDLLFLSLTG